MVPSQCRSDDIHASMIWMAGLIMLRHTVLLTDVQCYYGDTVIGNCSLVPSLLLTLLYIELFSQSLILSLAPFRKCEVEKYAE